MLVAVTAKPSNHYYKKDGSYLGSDKRDGNQVYVVNNYRIEKNGRITIISKISLRYNNGRAISVADFHNMVKATYYEMSHTKITTVNEAAAIYSCVRNRAFERKQTELQEFKLKGSDGLFQIRGWSKINNEDQLNEKKQKYTIAGIIKVIITNRDYSGGAYFWHGEDLGRKGSGTYTWYYKAGLYFTNNKHNLWNLPECKNPGKVGGIKWNYKFNTTMVQAHTTFMKLNLYWRLANDHKGNL